MQASLKAVVLACALAFSTSSYGFDLCGFIGYGAEPCGSGNPNCCDGCEPDRWIDAGCGCEASCGCDTGCGDSCEASCGCSEASCGCSGGYCVDGRKFAGRTYNCGCESYMPMCACTGPSGSEPSCGCGCGDTCEPSCGCGGGCGCKPKASCCSGLFSACGRMCSALCGGGSCGCSGEVYWSEWHNDPPRCSDPCNRCGQWIGPSAGCGGGGCGGGCNSCDSCGPGGCGCNGGNGGPVGGGYGGDGYYSSNRPTGAHGGTTFAANQRPKRTTTGSSVARTTPNPYTRARTARRPQQGANQQVQR